MTNDPYPQGLGCVVLDERLELREGRVLEAPQALLVQVPVPPGRVLNLPEGLFFVPEPLLQSLEGKEGGKFFC